MRRHSHLFPMSTGSLIIALARVRFRDATPARISLAAYVHLIIKPPTFAPLCKLLKMQALRLARRPSSHLQQLLKTLKELLYGKRKALLIGIQNPTEELIEECSPAASAIDSIIESTIASKPRAPRKKNHKVKKSKGASRSQEAGADALKGPHHDVQAMYDLLISASSFDGFELLSYLRPPQMYMDITQKTSSCSSMTATRSIHNQLEKILSV